MTETYLWFGHSNCVDCLEMIKAPRWLNWMDGRTDRKKKKRMTRPSSHAKINIMCVYFEIVLGLLLCMMTMALLLTVSTDYTCTQMITGLDLAELNWTVCCPDFFYWFVGNLIHFRWKFDRLFFFYSWFETKLNNCHDKYSLRVYIILFRNVV